MSKLINFSDGEKHLVFQSISFRIFECRSVLDDSRLSKEARSSVIVSLKLLLSLREKLYIALERANFELSDEEYASYCGNGF